MGKTLTLTDILSTVSERRRAWKLYKSCAQEVAGTFAERCEIEFIRPNMDRINKLTGQENDARYMAYAVEYIFMEAELLGIEPDPPEPLTDRTN